MSDFEQCLNRLQLVDLISLLVNFSCELWSIITIYMYDFLEARRMILSNA